MGDWDKRAGDVGQLIKIVNVLIKLDLMDDGITISLWEIVDRYRKYSLYQLSVDEGTGTQ